MRLPPKIKAWRGEAVLGTLGIIKLLGLGIIYKPLMLQLVKRQGIFDRNYYLETNNDVVSSGISPLRHYTYYGDKEGRQPMLFFDPTYYRAQLPKPTKQVNTLLHYAYVGRYRKISPSPWFDIDYYLANNKDVKRSGRDPLIHYLYWGGIEGRSPCPQFDSNYYLRTYPDVVAMRINPLLHYLLFGRLEGRSILPVHGSNITSDTDACELPPLALPNEDSWNNLTPRANIKEAQVDVVVPVYKARVETLRCLHSVLTGNYHIPFELIVINDGSPDAELTADLKRLAGLGLFTLLENPENRGFIYTVNRGMSLHKNRHVVLLNSDTEVYDDWLDKLHSTANRDLHTGTVTPLSNNATICSYPQFLSDNPYPLELSYPEINALTATVNAGVTVEAPTGVGFCLYIKRACLEAVGLFDEKLFGKGYGEENDFCQKAIQKGWRNLIAADIYVRHFGSASFQGERSKRVQDALKILHKRYPNYQKDVDDFIRLDPLKKARYRLDAARMQRMRKEKNVLIVSHNRGGGSERRVQEDILKLTQEGVGVFTLRPFVQQLCQVVIGNPAIRSLPNINPFILTDIPVLKAALESLGITEIHTHSLVDFTPEAPAYISQLVKTLDVRWEVNLHDYKVICPRINLADENGLYCGEPSDAECNRCLAERGSDFKVTDIRTWRALHERELITANRILVPDQDVADRLSNYFPKFSFTVVPHEDINPMAYHPVKPVLQPEEKLRVVIIGAIGKLKGFHVIISCAKQARQNNLPIEFIVMGYTMNDKLMEDTGVSVTGKYQEHEALNKLTNLNPHVVWLPSTWPETYSYTFSLALLANLPVFAFDIGAIARRAKESGIADLLMPLAWHNSPGDINHQFEKFRESCQQS
ncbi:MAG: glycosyltransferase [Methylovulum sp.]|nr:glycosyltransferase [Methylovulum sp.]